MKLEFLVLKIKASLFYRSVLRCKVLISFSLLVSSSIHSNSILFVAGRKCVALENGKSSVWIKYLTLGQQLTKVNFREFYGVFILNA